MDAVFTRNFILFAVILLSCSLLLSYSLINGDKDLAKTDDIILSTYQIINEAEQLSSNIEGMLASQRGFMMSHQDHFLQEYESLKANVSEHIAKLAELNSENQSQISRLDEIRHHYNQFTTKLEERARINEAKLTENSAEEESTEKNNNKELFVKVELLEDVEIIDSIKDNIVRINNAVLKEAYANLNDRVVNLEAKKSQYLSSLLVGVVFGTIILFLLNGYLLHAQRKRIKIEESLKETEDRYALAVDGTQDGIFDWDIKEDKVFYSGQFLKMLGNDEKGRDGDPEDFYSLVHPDDLINLKEHVRLYLDGKLSEYEKEFRVKHASGRWIWVRSRAKALFDKKGKPLRMVGAISDITHLIQAQEKLAAEKREAEEANLAKSEFLAHMSHEIRTPLTAISGIAEILEKNKSNLNDRQKKLLGTLSSSTAGLKDLINDVLDFSKIESGELELSEETFRLDEMFEEVISMMSVRANEKGISFLLDYSEIEGSQFLTDKTRFRQIIVNLIGNALKFTEEGSVNVIVGFEDREGDDFLRIEVADTGIGIKPEDFDLVFERFKQADSSVSRKYGGTGLGLPISKNLARLMGGDIFLSSKVGKGSTFTLLLPQKVTRTSAEKKSDIQEKIKKLDDKIRAKVTGESKALLVEDYEGNIVVLTYILDEIGINYDVAKTGLEAVNLYDNNHYDLILMDIQMPEMDGFTATKQIRNKEQQQEISPTPIIGMTAHALVGDKNKCIEAGMDAYLPKPIVESDLKKQILKFISPA